MMTVFKSYWSYWVYWNRQLGWAWKAAQSFLILMCIFLVFIVLPSYSENPQVRDEFQRMQVNQQSYQADLESKLSQSPARQLAVFEDGFPNDSTVVDSIDKLIALAEERDLTPAEATYHVVNNTQLNLISYQIAMPLNGSYTEVAGFISDALINLPNLALDNISLHRKDKEDEVIDVTLTLTLYVKKRTS